MEHDDLPPGFETAIVPSERYQTTSFRGATLPSMVRTPWRVAALSVGCVLGVIAASLWQQGGVLTAVAAVGGAVGAGLVALAGVGRRHVEVGCDGVLLLRMGQHQFVPLGEIVRADLQTARGAAGAVPSVRIHTRSPWMIDVDGASAGLLGARVQQALAACAQTPAERVEERLVAGGRAPRDWLVELRRIGAQSEAGPRRAAVDADELWRVLVRTAAPIEVRAGAAVALATQGAPDLAARFAALANGSASPALRAVLREAPGGRDAALVRALAAAIPRRR